MYIMYIIETVITLFLDFYLDRKTFVTKKSTTVVNSQTQILTFSKAVIHRSQMSFVVKSQIPNIDWDPSV